MLLEGRDLELLRVMRERMKEYAERLEFEEAAKLRDRVRASTYCADCGERVIGRDGYVITDYGLGGGGTCLQCGARLAGIFDHAPGRWGARRVPVRIAT